MINRKTRYVFFLLMGIIFCFQFLASDNVYAVDSDEAIKDIILEESLLFNDDLSNPHKVFKQISRGNLSMYVTLSSPKNLKLEKFLSSYFNQSYDFYIRKYNESHSVDRRVIHISCIEQSKYKNICGFKFNKSVYSLKNNKWELVSSRIFFLNISEDNGERIINSDILKLTKIDDFSEAIKSNIHKNYSLDKNKINTDLIGKTLFSGDQFFLKDKGIEFLFTINGQNYISKFNNSKRFINKKKLDRKLNGEKLMVCLTYDDGPLPQNSRGIVQILEKNNARATFFELGSNVRRYPESVLMKYEAGMEIENHSFSHSNFTSLPYADVRREIALTDAEIAKITGRSSSCFRPPYGSTNNEINRIVNKPIIFWSVDTQDWKSKDVDAIFSEVFSGGSLDNKIILLHSIHKETVNATAKIVPLLKRKGYQLVTLEELIKYKRKNQLINTIKYY